MSVCAQCHHYDWKFLHGNTHACPPRWEVYEEDHHEGWDDARIIYARDASEAAELYAQEADDGGDYDIVSGRSSPTVHVRLEGADRESGREIVFIVEGESVRHYTARFKEKKP